MKKILIILGILLSISLFNTAKAQININVNINSQPAWGPTGYDNASFYYMPDLNVYYDVNNALFYYLSGSKWLSNRYLPSTYSKYDLYNTYKVVINNKNKPWLENTSHIKNYSRYKQDKSQAVIKNSNDVRYTKSKSNTQSWVDSEAQTNRGQNSNNNTGNDNKGSNQNIKGKNNQKSRAKDK